MNMEMLHLHKDQHTAPVWGQGTAGHSSAPTASPPQGLGEHPEMNAGGTGSNPTLEGAVGLLGQGEVLLAEQVHGLVLADLHAGAHVAVPVQEEGERAGQVLTAKATAQSKAEVQDCNKLVSFSVVWRHFLTIYSLMLQNIILRT